jgi:hypothetical protein
MKLAGHGFAVDLPTGWEARLFRRRFALGAEQQLPVLHLANFPLPDTRGDFGAGVVEHLRADDVFMVLFDYGTEAADEPLFARRGMPKVTARDFQGSRLQRTIPGQLGLQHFFQEHGRGFCLYAVIGARRGLAAAVPACNAVLSGVQVQPW